MLGSDGVLQLKIHAQLRIHAQLQIFVQNGDGAVQNMLVSIYMAINGTMEHMPMSLAKSQSLARQFMGASAFCTLLFLEPHSGILPNGFLTVRSSLLDMVPTAGFKFSGLRTAG